MENKPVVMIIDLNQKDSKSLCNEIRLQNLDVNLTECFDNIDSVRQFMKTCIPDIMIIDPNHCCDEVNNFLKSNVDRKRTQLIITTHKHTDKESKPRLLNLKAEVIYKPFVHAKVKEILGKMIEEYYKIRYSKQYFIERQKEHFFLSNKEEGTVRIEPEHVVYTETSDSQVTYYFTNRLPFKHTCSTKETAEKLAPYGFFQVQ